MRGGGAAVLAAAGCTARSAAAAPARHLCHPRPPPHPPQSGCGQSRYRSSQGHTAPAACAGCCRGPQGGRAGGQRPGGPNSEAQGPSPCGGPAAGAGNPCGGAPGPGRAHPGSCRKSDLTRSSTVSSRSFCEGEGGGEVRDGKGVSVGGWSAGRTGGPAAARRRQPADGQRMPAGCSAVKTACDLSDRQEARIHPTAPGRPPSPAGSTRTRAAPPAPAPPLYARPAGAPPAPACAPPAGAGRARATWAAAVAGGWRSGVGHGAQMGAGEARVGVTAPARQSGTSSRWQLASAPRGCPIVVEQAAAAAVPPAHLDDAAPPVLDLALGGGAIRPRAGLCDHHGRPDLGANVIGGDKRRAAVQWRPARLGLRHGGDRRRVQALSAHRMPRWEAAERGRNLVQPRLAAHGSSCYLRAAALMIPAHSKAFS